MKPKKITFIDLFAGAGGLSEGFICAGYTPISHVEMNPDACNTLRTRACYHYLKNNNELDKYYDYLRSYISRSDLYSLVPKSIINSVIQEQMNDQTMDSIYARIDDAIKAEGISHVDLIIGGPPCQAYSQVGRSRKCMDNDHRNDLYKLYSQVLRRYEPKMFVFENVPGLITAGDGKYLELIKQAFISLGYELKYDVVDASEFGVLQRRKRIILIGWKKGMNRKYPVFDKIPLSYKICDILNDLPAIQAGQSSSQYRLYDFSQYLKDNEIRTKKDVLTWHVARGHIERDRSIYRLAIKAWNDNQRRLKYSELPDSLSTHKNKEGFLDRYKVVAEDLSASHTMMAHICKDGHYYIHPDLEQARSITVREAARIQSFPDSYYFEGSRTAAFTQIGNAVPPLMAKNVAIALRSNWGG